MSHSLMSLASNWLFLIIIAGIPLVGAMRGVKVYDTFVDGAKDGIQLIVSIVPYFVAMIVALGMFRASGAVDHIASLLGPMLAKVGFPVEILPLALVRPFSGAASNAVFVDILHNHGANSMTSHIAATLMGSTETTFYVIAVYFGSINILRIRHAAWAGLIADYIGVIASIFICRHLLYGLS